MNDSVARLEAKLRGEEWTKDGCDDGNCYYVTGSGNKPPKALWRTPLDHTSPAGMLWFMEALEMSVVFHAERMYSASCEYNWDIEEFGETHKASIIAAIESCAKSYNEESRPRE